MQAVLLLILEQVIYDEPVYISQQYGRCAMLYAVTWWLLRSFYWVKFYHVVLPISTIMKNIDETQVDVPTVRKCGIISPQPDQEGNKLMFLSEWCEFPSASCLAKKKKWQLASRCCWNRAKLHASELVSFVVGLTTYHHPGICRPTCIGVYSTFQDENTLYMRTNIMYIST